MTPSFPRSTWIGGRRTWRPVRRYYCTADVENADMRKRKLIFFGLCAGLLLAAGLAISLIMGWIHLGDSPKEREESVNRQLDDLSGQLKKVAEKRRVLTTRESELKELEKTRELTPDEKSEQQTILDKLSHGGE